MKVCVVRAHAVCVLASALGLMAIAAQSQSLDQVHLSTPAAAVSHRGNRPITVDVDLVLVPAVVTDSLNHPVTTLHKQDFRLLEGDSPQDIKYFAQEDAPISVGILLDTSGSMKSKFRLAQDALRQFFQSSNRDDDYFVITYSDRPQLLADTTQAAEEIEHELASVVPQGSTPLLDAIYLGLHKLKHARYQRRALLIISDGGDNNSRYTAKEIRKMVEESEVQIYALGMFPAVAFAIEDLQGRKLLAQISQATGGRAEFVSSPERLPEVAAEISRELRSQYILGYRPANSKGDSKLHRIIVKVRDDFAHPLQVYYKRQYLAER